MFLAVYECAAVGHRFDVLLANRTAAPADDDRCHCGARAATRVPDIEAFMDGQRAFSDHQPAPFPPDARCRTVLVPGMGNRARAAAPAGESPFARAHRRISSQLRGLPRFGATYLPPGHRR